MTYPYESTKIYRSKDFNSVVRKCYDNFKTFDGMEYGMFCVTNLDKNIEYKFQVNKNKVLKLTDDKIGGSTTNNNDELFSEISKESENNLFSEITVEDLEIKNQNNNCNII